MKSVNCERIARALNSEWSLVKNYDWSTRGRIWVFWDPRVWKVNVLSKSDQFISCYVSTVNNEVYFNATFVYGDNDPSLRRVVWRELRSCAAMIKTMLHGWS